MPSHEHAVSVDRLLAAARQRIGETNLRTTAAEIGIDFSSLSKLLNLERTPRESTRRKLTAWYLQRAQAGELENPEELLDTALTLLARCFPPALQQEVDARVRRDLRTFAEEHKLTIPGLTASSSY
jgi:transcriptional regulator with XRE-family HTH domain